MCAERDPTNCHRFVLVARHLAGRDVAVSHILPNGRIEAHSDTEQRLVGPKPQDDL